MAGIFYGWIGIYYGGHAQMWDTWGYHQNGIIEKELLFSNPTEYFTNLFRNTYENGVSQFLFNQGSYWNDLKGNFFIKILSVFDLLSFGNYFVNVIFYSAITLIGPLFLFRVMNDVFPGRRMIIMLASFLIPSFIYWTSGIQKEGLIFTGLGLIVYCIYFGCKEKRFTWKRISGIIIGLLLVVALRNYIIIILLPAILVWLLAIKWKSRTAFVYGLSYILFITIFFNAKYLIPELDFPNSVVTRQQEFLNLERGNTTVPIKELEPNFISFAKNTPQSFALSILRPYPTDVKHILSLAACLEIILFYALFVLFVIFRKRGNQSLPFVYFCLFFSVTMLLAIGFSVNNLGAIVRYRSLVLPFFIIPMAAYTDWGRIQSGLLNISKKFNINIFSYFLK